MQIEKEVDLQLFGGEGAAGDGGGATAGVGGEGAAVPNPGEQRLRELGVPEEVLKKREYRRANSRRSRIDQSAGSFPVRSDNQQIPAAAPAEAEPTETEGNTETAPKRMSWAEIMADPEYNQELQHTVNRRVKSAKKAEADLKTLMPALEVLARQYNLDVANIDYKALADAVNGDNAFYEQKGMEMGISAEKAKELDIAERNREREKREQEQTEFQNALETHTREVMRQAGEMKKLYPEFDLMKEMENPTFAAMTHPSVGVSVEDAYFAVHHKELQTRAMEVAAQQAVEKVSRSVQANGRRPVENGTSAKAPSETTFSYKNASRQEREAFKKMIMEAGARGEKIYPGQVKLR